ncbi:MAG: MFS transporter, partial [Clostridia bacterium]
MINQTLTKRNKWCYSIGGLRDCMYAFFTMYLIAYIQFTVKITTAQFAAISIIMIICLIWEAIDDPMMATILENARLKGGKYKPWIAIGAVTNGIVTILMFTLRLEGWGFVALFGLLYLLWGMTYTMNDIGYWSMLPSLTNDEKQRTELTTIMQILSSVGSFVTAGLVPMFTNGNAVSAYAVISIIVSLAFVAVQVVTVVGVTEPPRMPPREEDKISLKKMFSIIRKNDQLLWITVVTFFYYLGSGLLLMFGPNFCNFEFSYSNGGGILTLFTVVYAVGTLLGQFTFGFLAKKMRKKKIQTIGTISFTLGYILLLGFRYVLPAEFISIAIAGLLIFFGQSLFYLALLVQMTNTVEYNQFISGQKNESV